MEVTLTFGAWIRRQRRALDLTQEELAQEMGYSVESLRKIESGERRPSKQIVERLATVLAIPPADRPAFIAYARATDPDRATPPPSPSIPKPGNAPWQSGQSITGMHNLPLQLTSFIGRQQERTEVRQLLAGTRLVTLTGAGGSGKTRLALQVASELVSEFDDGVWWVDLARITDPDLVPQAVAAGLELRAEAQPTVQEQIAAYLQRRQVLLLLDNCEHLIVACAAFADAMLCAAPRVTILATSREPLAIGGETTYRVPSLQVVDPSCEPSWTDIAGCEAARLFAERGAAAIPGFTVGPDNAALVADICRRLDGIPLAIELAAARVKVLPLEDIRGRLHDRFQLLTGGSRLALPRQQTLRATLDWSYSLLAQPERRLLCRLAVFAGGWTLESAEAVCGPVGLAGPVLETLAGLVDKSLVVLGWQGHSGRYGMLETTREYASERLVESGEEAAVRGRHAEYFATLAEQAEPHLYRPEQNSWLARLEDEHSNLRQALEHLRDQGEVQVGLRLAGALWRFWEVRGYLGEGHGWLADMLRLAGTDADTAARARALLGAGVCGFYQRDNLAAVQLADSLRLYRALGDRRGMSQALLYQGWMLSQRGAFGEARALFEESAALCREDGDRRGLGWALGALGLMAWWAADNDTARRFLEQALALSRELDDEFATVTWLEVLAWTMLDLGELGPAQALAAEGMLRCRELGDRRDLCGSLEAIGMATLAKGHPQGAEMYLDEALALARELEDKFMLAATLNCFAVFSLAQALPGQALRLAGASAAIGETAGFILPRGRQVRLDRAMEVARQAVGPGAATEMWNQGRATPLAQLITEVLQERST